MKSKGILIVLVLVGTLSFTACKQTTKSVGKSADTDTQIQNFEEIGLQYALATQAELGKNLMGALQKEGATGALEYCNTRAYPLTDSMSTVFHARIKRVSDKPRNPANIASDDEMVQITYFKQQIAANKKTTPIVKKENEGTIFYYPIVTNAICLQCHGIAGSQILPETLTLLQERYPQDMATGYDVNEVRGIWSIYFDKDPDKQ
tara:strand:- start:2626 stop:3240 length:615 start_codon:yes stop_codon:yes gene_type:complete